MKILHLVAGNLNGGAAKGAYILHKGLLKQGINSKILTNSRDTFNDPTVTTINRNNIDRIKVAARGKLDQLPTKFYKNKEEKLFSPGICGYDFTKQELYQESEIIHLHWINSGFVNLKHLCKINKPIIWTIRDMWPFTGGCHYSLDCDRFKKGCGKCPQLGSSSNRDLSSYVWNRKSKYIPDNVSAVGISPWVSKQLKESTLFHDKKVYTIFNNIDCEEFYPIDKVTARKILKFNTSKKLILVGAQNVNDYYKGFNKFVESVGELDPNKYFLVFFGKLDNSKIKDLGFEYRNFGFLYDTISLRLLYSAADVFVAPSLMEAFGKTIAESMACGTPVVCFNVTGPKDMVSHKIDGYKSKPYDAIELSSGIEWICHAKKEVDLSINTRKKALNNFHGSAVAKQYKNIYSEINNEY